MGSSLVPPSAGLLVLLVGAGALGAQTASSGTQTQTAPQAAIPTSTVAFRSDAGVVLNFIKPEKTADFERVIGKIREALKGSNNPDRQRQANGWRVFRSPQPAANGAVLYVFVMDPAVKSADYSVSKILVEAFPDEAEALYKQFADSYAGARNIVNLTLLSAFGDASH